MSLLLFLNDVLLSDLLLDLFQCLQEELLDLTPLIKHNLGKGPHIPQFFVFNSQVLSGVDNGLTLLLNNALVLVPDHFFLLLEVTDDLSQAFFQNLDFVLVGLDFLSLLVSSLLVLLLSSCIDGDIALDLFISLLMRLDLFLLLVQFVTLRDCLQCQVLVFLVDLPFNGEDSCREGKERLRHQLVEPNYNLLLCASYSAFYWNFSSCSSYSASISSFILASSI